MPAEQSNLCDDIQPWLAAYALGDADEQAEARAHLMVCPRCQHVLQEYRLVASLLPYSAPDIMPQPELRQQLIATVERQAAELAEAAPPQPARPAPPAAPAIRPRRARSFWAALAFAALGLVLLGWNISLQGELNRQTAQVAMSRQNWQTMIMLLNDSALRWYAMTADSNNGGAQFAANGHVWATPQGQLACLVAQALPELPPGQVYQVWLVHGGQQASGGTFEARNGNAWTFVETDEPIADYSEIFVTIEPAGGSSTPGGQRVLSGTLSAGTMAGLAERQELWRLLRDAEPLGI